MSTFINDTKYTDLNYNGRGDTIFLAQCTCSANGYGNNTYKMLAIYDEDHSDEDIIKNMNKLTEKYLNN